jgi:1,5-anhydro-D-fructose reductase (1,5-anhydro-D-mannitol-forming)
MTDAPLRRLTLRKIDDRSVGFLVAGASTVAARWMLDAIWGQPPAIGGSDVAGAYVVGLYSHNARFARRFADAHGIIHADDDLDRLLARREIRCVYVGSHPRYHAATVRAALLAGKHVLCEPPLARTPEESQELEQMARHRGLVLALNYTWRATGVMRRLRDALHADAIGEILGVRIDNMTALPLDRQSWRIQPPDGGVLWDRTLHDIDLLAFLLLSSPAEIQSHTLQSLLGSAVEEDVVSVVRLRNGLPAVLHDAFVLPHAPTGITIYGSTGTLQASNIHPDSAPGRLELQRGGQVQSLEFSPIDPYRAAVARFLAAVRLGEAPLATPRDDRRAVLAVLAAHQSLQQRQVRTLPHERQ